MRINKYAWLSLALGLASLGLSLTHVTPVAAGLAGLAAGIFALTAGHQPRDGQR